ncbi:MAG TPA: TonB family protein [Terriglobales bacterium]|jgi:periplasmic protein TonB|nr:TonB family protein [Terriglobales bacterium]
MAASADRVMHDIDIYSEHGQLRRPLAWSFGLHLAFAGFVVFYAVFINGFRGTGWGSGGGGDAMGATLVSAVPLPANPVETTNVVATESKGLAKSQPTVQEKEPEAIPIPDKNAKTKIKPAPVKSATQRKAEPEPIDSNQIPYGEGGPASGPYTMSAGGAKGGFGFTGNGGDFGSQYAWYVQAVQRKVTENWLKYEVDPRITEAKRVYLTFDIGRDGHPSNVQVEQSSGVPSLDQSAARALQRIDTFGPLPADYSGSKVSVEFWFDYKR